MALKNLRYGLLTCKARGMAHDYGLIDSELLYEGRVIKLRRDRVSMPGGGDAVREVVEHPGAVGVVAYDERGRIMMVNQYRHPVGKRLWELPAGLLDVPGEPASTAAKRELAEEAALAAQRWDTLVDTFSSPGMTDEATRVFLARGITELAPEHPQADEEADMELAWVPLGDAIFRVMQGDITNALAVIGILAAAHARSTDFEGLRASDAAWPARPDHLG
ncbi:MAG: nudF [Mycobacterium sp.]|nr:nudF [Mycobacterium sp.]